MTWEWLGAIGSILGGLAAVGAWIISSINKKIDDKIEFENEISEIKERIKVLEVRADTMDEQIKTDLTDIKKTVEKLADKMDKMKDCR